MSIRCPTALPFGTIGQHSESGIASGVTTTLNMNPASGYKFRTNDPTTFVLGQLSTGEYGLALARSGLYVSYAYMNLLTNNGIIHSTTTAQLQRQTWLDKSGMPFTDGLVYGAGEVPSLNVGQDSSSLDAAPQQFDCYQTLVVNAPDGDFYPTKAISLTIYQNSGFPCDAIPSLWVTRLSDPIAAGLS